MKILLLGMPDAVSALDNIFTIPNTGLCSIAAHVESCDVRVLDLAAYRKQVRKTILHQLNSFQPDVVGLSAMTFQFFSAVRIAGIVRKWNPDVPVVLGGYHCSLLYEELGKMPEAQNFDYLVRGEGEITFRNLINALKQKPIDVSGIKGLSYRRRGDFFHNPPAPLQDLATLVPPNRKARIFSDFNFFGYSFDCIETSRGCVRDCSFCSITKMYGKRFRKFPLERVLYEISALRKAGTKGIFFVDDNITLDIGWLKKICNAIISSGFNDLHFIIQASVDGLSSDLSISNLLAAAGFRFVFLGIESGSQRNLDGLKKNYNVKKTRAVVSKLKSCNIAVMGGFIVGHPNDQSKDIRNVFRYAHSLGVDHAIVQCLTPYPKTNIREQLLKEGLVTNPYGFDRYNGFAANVRTRHMNSRELSQAIVKWGIPYYMNPRYMKQSKLWRYRSFAMVYLFINNLKFIYSGWRNRMFLSTHRF